MGFGDDFQFISCNSADETAAMVRQLYQEEAARNGLDHVQILTPYRVKTVNGANELNRSLEDLINPPSPGKKELSAGGQTYREGG